MTTAEMIEVMQAYENGAEIEFILKEDIAKNIWKPAIASYLWDWASYDYRVKQPEQPKQKLWYGEFRDDNSWFMSADRRTEEDAKDYFGNKCECKYRKLEALGFIEE